MRHLMTCRLRHVLSIGLCASAGLIAGCSTYTTPGAGADMRALGISTLDQKRLTEPGIAEQFNKKPLANFPAAIAVARVQSSGYRSRTSESYGTGAYSIVTTRDVESDAHFERLAKLPMIRGIAPMSRLTLPSHLSSDHELRSAAAQIHADMILLYTFDTKFYVRDYAKPVSIITLGLSPNKKAFVTTTASAALMDTRSGYIYGTAETTAKREQLTNTWDREDTIDSSRLKTETEAFDKLVGELEKTWAGVAKEYAGTTPRTVSQAK